MFSKTTPVILTCIVLVLGLVACDGPPTTEPTAVPEAPTVVVTSEVTPTPEPWPDEYWTDQFSEEGSGEKKCKSGFAVAGVACYGDHCDNKSLLCRPYTSPPDNLREANWHPQVISEEQPNASFRTDLLPPLEFVNGLRCMGDYCDLITFYVITTPYIRLAAGTSEWGLVAPPEGRVKDESLGSHICEKDEFVTGFDCKEDYCGVIYIRCTPTRFHNP